MFKAQRQNVDFSFIDTWWQWNTGNGLCMEFKESTFTIQNAECDGLYSLVCETEAIVWLGCVHNAKVPRLPYSEILKGNLDVGLSVKISRCRHLKKIIVNWLVSLLSLLRQQSLLFIDYIYFIKSKSYAWDMQAKLKERKIILENFAALRKER